MVGRCIAGAVYSVSLLLLLALVICQLTMQLNLTSDHWRLALVKLCQRPDIKDIVMNLPVLGEL